MKAGRKVSAALPMEHTATNVSHSSSSGNYNLDEHENNINQRRRLNLKEFIEQTKDLITSTNDDRGPPRWFSPLESGNRWKDSPLLLYLPGDPLKMAMASGQRALPLPQIIQELSENLSTRLSSISVVADGLPRESLLWKLKLLESASSFANSCIHAVKAQTLILASGRDQLLPSLEEADRLSDVLPTCKKRYFKDSGHTLFMVVLDYDDQMRS